MIVIQCIGGLGNQMFQYALYEVFRLKKIEVALDISEFSKYKLHNGYELEKVFNISPLYAQDELVNNIKLNKNNYFKKSIRKFFPNLIKHKCIPSDLYDESIFSYESAYLEGYWQNFDYFKDFRKEIQKAFSFNMDCLDYENTILLQKIIQDPNSVSLHIRRGDYVSSEENKKIYGNICDLDYYKKAIDIIKETVKFPTFYIFSDDCEWAKQNLKVENCIFIDHNKGRNSYKDMLLMSKCKHNITANSTFSWWGSYLNNNEQKIVVMPKKWTNMSNNRLIYPGCIVI